MSIKLFLDVDDVISVLSPNRRAGGLTDWKTRKVTIGGGTGALRERYKIVWSPTVVDRLGALPADRMWASSWGVLANRHLAPLFRWAPLLVAAGPTDETDRSWSSDDPRKIEAILDHADCPFVWVDDSAITSEARAALSARVSVPYLLVAPDPDFGLTLTEIESIETFVAEHLPPGARQT